MLPPALRAARDGALHGEDAVVEERAVARHDARAALPPLAPLADVRRGRAVRGLLPRAEVEERHGVRVRVRQHLGRLHDRARGAHPPRAPRAHHERVPSLERRAQGVLGEERVLESAAAHRAHGVRRGSLGRRGHLRGEEVLVAVVAVGVEEDLDDRHVAVGHGGARLVRGDADGFAHGLLRVAIDEHDVLPRIDVRVEPTRGAEQRAARRVAVVHARGGPARVLHPDA